ncbi:MAG: hypothetical protein QXV16_01255 [Candidatus Anstonellales archaeon]
MAFFSETSQTPDVNKERALYLEPMTQSPGELNVNGAKIRFIKQKDGVFVELQDGQKIQMKEGDVLVVSKDGKYTVIRPENREEVISRLLENGYSVMIWHRNELYKVSFDKDTNRAVAKLNGNNVENLTAGVRKNEDAYQKWREGERDNVRLKDVREEYRKLSFDQRRNLFETARKITLGKSEMSEEQRKILESLREDIAKLRSLGLSEQEILNRYFGSEHGKIIYDLYTMQKKLYREKKYDFDTYVAALLMSLGAKTTNNYNQNTSTETSYESQDQEQVVATLNREGKATVNIDGVEISISYVKDGNGNAIYLTDGKTSHIIYPIELNPGLYSSIPNPDQNLAVYALKVENGTIRTFDPRYDKSSQGAYLIIPHPNGTITFLKIKEPITNLNRNNYFS